jgi:hypothetical protein
MTTAQYLSAAVTVAVLTVVLGTSPTDGRFRWAFLVTVAAATAGAILAAASYGVDRVTNHMPAAGAAARAHGGPTQLNIS